MKNFDELMSVSNEIENITAEDAKKKLMTQMSNLLMLEIKKAFQKEQ